jgi:hypothetical protein
VKDGIGALGRFFVGGRLGREFDDDPRYWRMVAEAVATVGEQGCGRVGWFVQLLLRQNVVLDMINVCSGW